jgi:hypothetical protein
MAMLALTFLVHAKDASAALDEETVSAVEGGTVKAVERTMEEMEKDDAWSLLLAPENGSVPFNRPTMDPASYEAAKKAAAEAYKALRPGLKAPNGPLAPPALGTVNCNGKSQAGWYPPDTDGAVGLNDYAQIVNSHFVVYRRSDLNGDVNVACAPAALNVSLAAFFNYYTMGIFDPQVVYDAQYKRWIVTAVSFPENATTMYLHVAVSKYPNAAGAYYIYRFDTDVWNNGDFWDYPHVGYDEHAIVITGNIFNPGYVGSRVTILNKARMYMGLPVVYNFWWGSILDIGTIMPPIVFDYGPETWLASAPNNGNFIRVTRWLTGVGVMGQNLGYTDIPVTAYTIAPDAPQPGTSELLDTIDNRFVNRSTQWGNYLYNIHTVFAGPAALQYYKMHVPNGVIADANLFWSSGISSDFNASVTANSLGDVFLTWSRSDSATFPQVRFGGKNAGDAAMGQGTAYTSPSSLTGNGSGVQRWGDYSYIALDPGNNKQAYGVNETVQSGGAAWGSRVFRIKIP